MLSGRRDHGLLADQLDEGGGSVLAGKDAVGSVVGGGLGGMFVGHRMPGAMALTEQYRPERWETGTTTRTGTRCGCFLPDLTGLASGPSAASLPLSTITGTRASRKSGVEN